MKSQDKPTVSSLRVTKELAPESCGAMKLARRFGESLVCVRHRSDDTGEFPYTNVELLVEKIPLRPRTDTRIGIRIKADGKQRQTIVREAGETWDSKFIWRLSRRLVGILKLVDRVTDKQLPMDSKSICIGIYIAACGCRQPLHAA